MPDFRHLKPGDKVTRLLGGEVTMAMQVTSVDEEVLVCAAVRPDGRLFHGHWQFDRETGAEEDHEIGWGKKFGVTGSYLVLEN
jgi:hypothetical protein